MPSDLWRFLPLAVFLTCLAEMVLLPTRFFFASAISIPLNKGTEDTAELKAAVTDCSRAADGAAIIALRTNSSRIERDSR